MQRMAGLVQQRDLELSAVVVGALRLAFQRVTKGALLAHWPGTVKWGRLLAEPCQRLMLVLRMVLAESPAAMCWRVPRRVS
jgi:hypothetical protein